MNREQSTCRGATFFSLAALLWMGAVAQESRADWAIYRPLGLLIQASETRVLPGGTVLIRTAAGPMYVPLDSVEVIKKPTVSDRFDLLERQSIGSRNPDKMMEAANFALKSGMLKPFHRCVDKALEFAPGHAEAKRLVELRARLDQEVPENPKQREDLRKLIRKSGMKFKRSKHFLLMYDTDDKPEVDEDTKRERPPRADARLALLERVYEAFYYKFYGNNVALEIPKEPLKVVLFKEHRDYDAFAKQLGDDMASTAGFYEHTTNTSVFFDQGSHEQFKKLLALDRQIQAEKKQAIAAREKNIERIVNLAKAIRLLVYIERESQDIEVVSHEATHQLAANSGLLPKHVMIPSWVHEGLATYFESPNNAAWAGFGAVNKQRLEWYRALERDRAHSNIDFIVGDQIFNYARTSSGILHGYAQAWALTHFLVEKHFDRYVGFCRRLGEMPPDTPISSQQLTVLFNSVFNENRSRLDSEWRSHMGSLKPVEEEILER